MSLLKSASFDIYAEPLTSCEIAKAEGRWDAVLVAAFVLQVLALCMGYALLHCLGKDPQVGFLLAVLLAALSVGGCQALLTSRIRFTRQLTPIEPNDCLFLAHVRDDYPVVAEYLGKALAQNREVLRGELEAVRRYIALRQTSEEIMTMRNALYERLRSR